MITPTLRPFAHSPIRPFGLCLALGSLAGCDRPAPRSPTFSSDVAAILHANCAQCHRPGGPAPFALLTYEEARGRAGMIAAAARAGRMPPWLPEPTEFAFADDRRLTDREITILERWAAQRAPLGDSASLKPPRGFKSGWSLGEPDLVLEMPEPYEASGAAPDVFRNFVLPATLQERRYVRAVDFDFGVTSAVHHVIMGLDTSGASRQEDARDQEPGFDGMFTRAAARPPAGFYVGWTPGRVARNNPAGLAWALEPGSDVVVQTHLRPHQHAGPLRARVGFYYADTIPRRTPVLLRLGSQTLDIPAGTANYTVTDSLRLPVETEVLGLYPHAHYLGKVIDVRAAWPNGKTKQLLRIDDWDFNWQDVYTFERPVRLPAGTIVYLRYMYDNSVANAHNPHKPPQRVVYGPNSSDEMAELWIQAVPRSERDLAVLQREVARKALHDRVEGSKHLVTVNPRDAAAHAFLGAYYNSAGDTSRAIEHYRRAVEAQPDFAAAHYNLGLILEGRGDLEGAALEYDEALRARPDHAGTHNNLGNVLLAQGKPNDAAVHFRRSLELEPSQAEAHNNLGRLLWDAGRTTEAIEHYQRAVALRPNAAAARFNLALGLASIGRTAESMEQLEAGVRLEPAAVEAVVAMAWLLATHPDPQVRRPVIALTLANRARQMIGQPHPRILDALAAAEAAAGRYELAAAYAVQAVQLSLAAGDSVLAERIRARMQLYLERKPYIAPKR